MNYHTETAFVNRLFSVYFIFYIFINVIPTVRTFTSAAVYRLCVSAAVVVQSLWHNLLYP